jgi:hypothetical protein
MIREILDKLDLEQRRILAYALDHDISQVIKLPPDTHISGGRQRFVGININPGENMVVEEATGAWKYGYYK